MRRVSTAVLAIVLLLRTGAAFADNTKLVLWHAYRGSERAALEKVVTRYNAQHPKLQVVPVAMAYEGFPEKLAAAIAHGNGPDVFIYAQDRLTEWVDQNVVAQLDGIPESIMGRFMPITREAVRVRGHNYGFPLNYKVLALIYNRDLVPAPPTTTRELVETAKRLTTADKDTWGFAFQFSNFYYLGAISNAFTSGARGTLFETGEVPRLSNSSNMQAAALIQRWMDEHVLPRSVTTGQTTALFNSRRAAMVIEGPWFLGEIRPDVHYGVAMLPTVDEAAGAPMRPWITVEGLFVSGRSKVKSEAIDFAKFVTGTAAGATLAVEGRQTPANKKVYDDPAVVADPYLRVFYQQAQNAIPMPREREVKFVWPTMAKAMIAVADRELTPKGALESAQKRLEEAIAAAKK